MYDVKIHGGSVVDGLGSAPKSCELHLPWFLKGVHSTEAVAEVSRVIKSRPVGAYYSNLTVRMKQTDFAATSTCKNNPTDKNYDHWRSTTNGPFGMDL